MEGSFTKEMNDGWRIETTNQNVTFGISSIKERRDASTETTKIFSVSAKLLVAYASSRQMNGKT